MNRNKAIYLSLALCALIFAAYFIILGISKKDVSDGEKDIYLYVDQNDISKISAFSFTGGEYNLSFQKEKEGVWRYTKNTTLPINTAVIENMLESTETVLAQKLISENASEDDLMQYGLAYPEYTLRIFGDHGEKCYLFGDLISSKGLRYFMKEGSSVVYLASDSMVESFSLELSDCLFLDKAPQITAESILTIKSECGEFSQTDTADDSVSLATALSNMVLERAVDFGADKFDIFGLSDNECILVTITHSSSETVRIKFGLGETDEFIYALIENENGVFSEMIYLISVNEEEMNTLNSHLRDIFNSKNPNGEQ